MIPCNHNPPAIRMVLEKESVPRIERIRTERLEIKSASAVNKYKRTKKKPSRLNRIREHVRMTTAANLKKRKRDPGNQETSQNRLMRTATKPILMKIYSTTTQVNIFQVTSNQTLTSPIHLTRQKQSSTSTTHTACQMITIIMICLERMTKWSWRTWMAHPYSWQLQPTSTWIPL